MRNFSVLSDIEFENLAADLISEDIGRHVERFSRGADGGIDMRWHTSQQGLGLGQAKHYSRSTWSQLHAAAKAELENVRRLDPEVYRFLTTYDLGVGQKDTLYELFRPWMSSKDQVLGASDIDAALSRSKQVEQKHVKLWLSTGSQLFWATHSDILNRSEALQNALAKTLDCYVESNAFQRATSILKEHRVCLIAGEPGIGKTVLAHILVMSAIAEGFTPVEVSGDIDEAWTALDNNVPQVFLYDDFLGQISFSERMGKNEDKRLAAFVEKVSGSNSKLLVMTTREYILRDARRDYHDLESLESHLHFLLELGAYTRRNKADILYNHLWRVRTGSASLGELASGGWKRIVDHPGYNPRLVQYCTGNRFDVDSPGYLDRFVEVLDHPETLWGDVYHRHLSLEQRAILTVMASMPGNAPLCDLRTAYFAYCESRGIHSSPGVFTSGLDVLDQTFIKTDRRGNEIVVSFQSPSVAEYVIDQISEDPGALSSLIASAPYFEQLTNLLSIRSGGVSLGLSGSAGSRATPLPLDRLSEDIASSLKRTFYDENSPERLSYQEESEEAFAPPVGLIERRLSRLLLWNSEWKPEYEWFEQALSVCANRWHEGIGGRAAALDVLRRLPFDLRASPTGESAIDALQEWLESDLSETFHWNTYLMFLDEIHGVSYPEGLAEAFCEHAENELWRWSPSPPDLDELISHASKFGLSELEASLKEKAEEEDSGGPVGALKATEGTPNPQQSSSDEEIERIFSRFVGGS